MPQVHSPVIGNMLTIAMRGTDISPGENEKNTTNNKWVVDALWTLDTNHQINGIFAHKQKQNKQTPKQTKLPLSFPFPP